MTTDALAALTDKEKQCLRLIVRGHDAKSVARELGLSVHTINERLRDTRRKLAVSSSREAARLLFECEGAGPQSIGDTRIGEAAPGPGMPAGLPPATGARRPSRRLSLTIGASLMTLILGLLAFAALPHLASAPAQQPSAEAPDAAVVDAARRFLVLLDQGRWDDSYRATGTAFRALNTSEVWASVSRKVRAPLGAAISRTLLSQENLPAPPRGYEVVKFRTRFANGKADAVETVTLDREDGGWRVVGITVG